MTTLKRSDRDDHLYILAGPSQGTWQITEEGVSWLRSKKCLIPGPGGSVSIDPGTYRRLKANGYLYIYHIPYEKQDSQQYIDNNKSIPTGLPFLLQLLEQKNPSWELAVDLSVLFEDEKVWTTLQRHQAACVTINNASWSLPLRQLHNIRCLLKVWPQTVPYFIQWEDSQHKMYTLEEAPRIQGLTDGWQGNVFIESTQKAGLWRQCLPNSTVSFYETLLWLAKTQHKPEWPGNALAIGQPYMGWQLWRLELNDHAVVAWEKMEGWLSYRSIDLVHQRQHLQIISPPEAVTGDGWYISKPGQPLLIQCSPPRRQIKGTSRQVYLSAVTFSSDSSHRARSSQSDSELVPADQVSYFRWLAPQAGQYRINLEGNVSAEELLISETEQSVASPQWLYGISCTVSSSQVQQTFHTFKAMSDVDLLDERNILNKFKQHELPMLTWSLEPAGLPISMSWEYVTTQKIWQRDSLSTIQSGEQLTAYWQERIWPTIEANTNAKITLDAGSFGLIELSLAPFHLEEKDIAWWTDNRLVSQFTWLGQVLERRPHEAQMAIPASLRKDISQLRAQAVAKPFLYTVLDRLARKDAAPPWILVRLQILIAEIQKSKDERKTETVMERP